jgi:RNA polymerase sigma factor (TIGR02999 family)
MYTTPDPERPDAAELTLQVYRQLRELARSYLRREGGYQTLQPTALVHEAYIRMEGIDRIEWAGKTHFFAVAARQMRRVLVEHARAAVAQKRGGKRRRVTLHDGHALTEARSLDLLALEQALEILAERSPRQAKVAELRLFAGMGAAEACVVLDVSERTARGDWRVARAWLSRELASRGGRP